jgi:predicted PurR-regulated permease PerM
LQRLRFLPQVGTRLLIRQQGQLGGAGRIDNWNVQLIAAFLQTPFLFHRSDWAKVAMPQFASASRLDQRPSGRAHLHYAGLVPAAIVVAGLYFGRPVLLPLAMAIVLAFALAPIVSQLRRLHFGQMGSVFAAAMLAIGIIVAGGFLVGEQVIRLAGQLPVYQDNITAKIESLRGATVERGALENFVSVLKNLRQQALGESATSSSPAPAIKGQRPSPAPVPVEVHPPQAAPVDFFIAVSKPVLESLLMASIVFVFVVFILLRKEDLRDRFIRLAGEHDMQRTTLLLEEGADGLSRYLLTQAAINACFGLLVGTGLWLIGVPSPLLWGLCVFVLRFVPYIGVPLGAIPPIILALGVDPGWSLALETAALILFGEAIAGQAIEPWLYGKSTGLSPVAVVVSATFWTALWGPLGLLLANPLTMCLVLLGRHIEHLKFLDVLLGDRPALGNSEALYLRMLGEDPDQAAAEAESFLKENSLCSYYNDVALKALTLAEIDINRGVLDQERAEKITETTRALIQNLSQADGVDTSKDSPATSGDGDRTVFCVGGRDPVDEAAALLLIHLLEQAGIVAELITAYRVRTDDGIDFSRAKVVCLCYVHSGNAVRAAYLLRRVRRLAPRAIHFAAFWDAKNGDEISKGLGCDVVVTLEEAVSAIQAATAPSQAPRTPPLETDSRPLSLA